VGAAGHSLGEFSALVAAGALPLADALRVVVIRGQAMQRAGAAAPGTMTALLGVGPDDAELLCEDARGNDVLLVANRNSPVQSVISGSVAAIERAETLAAERRIRAVRLDVAGAFHTPLMEPAVQPILDALADVEFATPEFPIAENVSGALEHDPDELRSLVERHVVSPVRWQDDARALAAAGATRFIECGPGDVLTKMAKRVVPEASAVAVGSPEAAVAAVSSAP
jgi:[acyl-carrier-protein] S-malonyltransferase